MDNNVKIDNMFRTDLGDDEDGEEWAYGRVKGTVDPVGDDDVDIVIRADGRVEVDYRTSHDPVPQDMAEAIKTINELKAKLKALETRLSKVEENR